MQSISSKQLFFLRKLQLHTDVACMQFEKRGRKLLGEAFRSEGECVACLKQGGEKRKSVISTPMFTSVFQDQYYGD